MPTGTRSSISTNRTTKPRMAMASGLIEAISFHRFDLLRPAQQLRVEDQAIGTRCDQNDRRDVADPRQQKERPGGKPKVEGEHVVGARGPDLVVERPSLHRDHE